MSLFPFLISVHSSDSGSNKSWDGKVLVLPVSSSLVSFDRITAVGFVSSRLCFALCSPTLTLHSPASWTSVRLSPLPRRQQHLFPSGTPPHQAHCDGSSHPSTGFNTQTSLKRLTPRWTGAGWFSSVLLVVFLFVWRELTSKTNHFLFHFVDFLRPKRLFDVHFCLFLNTWD